MSQQPLPMDSLIRVKPIYPVYRLDTSRFRIGAQFGLTIEVNDPQEHLWTLVSALDGRLPLREVIKQVCAAFPELTDEDVIAAVGHLDAKGFLEDATVTGYDRDGDLSRYVGNVNYLSHFSPMSARRGEMQDRLREAHCVLFGLGGGGSFALPLLLAAGFGQVTAVDYDRVERTNLNRQLMYRESDIGALKTSVAARLAGEVNPGVRFTAVQKRIDSAAQAAQIVRGADIAICAIDEPPFIAQRRVNAGCVSAGVPYVCGGSFVTSGRMFSVRPGVTGCLDCLHLHYTRTDPGYLSQLKTSLRVQMDRDVTIAFAPHIALVVSLLVAEAVRLVTGHAEPLGLGQQVEIQYETGNLKRLTKWERDSEGCPVCGDGAATDAFDVWRAAEAEEPQARVLA
jgi:molybdopterin/thiamine biosynthesis adenylyltransferase